MKSWKRYQLKISKQVEKELKNKGYQVVMTREKDQMLAGETSGNSKIKDMKARVDLINEKAPGLAVSIHQNSYHEEEIHGAQVFYYSHSVEGHTAAKLMQQALLGADSENTRQEKANDTYYLLRRTQVPDNHRRVWFPEQPTRSRASGGKRLSEKNCQGNRNRN